MIDGAAGAVFRGYQIRTGDQNIAIGYKALNVNTTGMPITPPGIIIRTLEPKLSLIEGLRRHASEWLSGVSLWTPESVHELLNN